MKESHDLDLDPIFNLDTEAQVVRSLVASHCRIDTAHLDEALAKQASLYAYCVAAFEMAKVDEARAKHQVDVAEAASFGQAKESTKTVTEAEKKVKTMPAVVKAVAAKITAQELTGRLKALVAGLEHRKDMLIQISARQRMEMAG